MNPKHIKTLQQLVRASNIAKPSPSTVGKLQLGSRAARAGKSTAKVLAKPVSRPVGSLVRGAKQTGGALASLTQPRQALQYYRNAAEQAQLPSALHAFLQDTAGRAAGQPSKTWANVLRTVWNPRVPSVRRGGQGTLGSGQPVGKAFAATGTLGALSAAGAAGYRGVVDQPVTGVPHLDVLWTPERRREFNRQLYFKNGPRVLWSGWAGDNAVDKEVAKHLWRQGLPWFLKKTRQKLLETQPEAPTGLSTAMAVASRAAGHAVPQIEPGYLSPLDVLMLNAARPEFAQSASKQLLTDSLQALKPQTPAEVDHMHIYGGHSARVALRQLLQRVQQPPQQAPQQIPQP